MSSDAEWSGSDFEEGEEERVALENQEADLTQPLMKGWTTREHHLFVEALRRFATRWPEYAQYFPTKSTQDIKLYGLKLHDLIFKSPNKAEVFNRVVQESEKYLKRRSKKTAPLPIKLPSDERFLEGRSSLRAATSTPSPTDKTVEEEEEDEDEDDEESEEEEEDEDEDEEEEEETPRRARSKKAAPKRPAKGKSLASPPKRTPARQTPPTTPAPTPVRQSRRLSGRGIEGSAATSASHQPATTPSATTTAAPSATAAAPVPAPSSSSRKRKQTQDSEVPEVPTSTTTTTPSAPTAPAAAAIPPTTTPSPASTAQKKAPKRQKTTGAAGAISAPAPTQVESQITSTQEAAEIPVAPPSASVAKKTDSQHPQQSFSSGN